MIKSILLVINNFIGILKDNFYKQINQNLLKKKNLNENDIVEYLIQCKNSNLEKNLPLILLEIDIQFEIKNCSIDLSHILENSIIDSSSDNAHLKYLFFESPQTLIKENEEIPLDKLQNQMKNVLIRDLYSPVFNKFFKKNEYISKH